MKKIVGLLFVLIFSFSQITFAQTFANKTAFLEEYELARLVALAAQTCSGTYVPEGKASEYSYLKYYGFKITPYAKIVDGVNVHFMVATNPQIFNGRRLSVIAVRGSADKKDWDINLQTKKVPFASQTVANINVEAEPLPKGIGGSKIPSVHEGFNAYTKAALSCDFDIDGDGTMDNLAQRLKDDPKLMVLLTGHSLGGAVATLMGEYLIRSGVPKEQLPVITFGAPAVGNAAFARTYGNKINLQRYATSLDPVPGGLQSFFGGYKQFGTLHKFPLSSKYSGFQHPVSFYFDLALKNYYNIADDGVAAGYLAPPPLEQTKGTGPLVAIVLTAMNNSPDARFAPDVKRFVLEEYLTMFPRYTVLATNLDQTNDVKLFEELKEEAQKKGASYLLLLDVDRHSVGQTNKWYVGVNQGVFKLPGAHLITMTTNSTRIPYNAGVIQSTIEIMEDARDELKNKLPFMQKNIIPSWKEAY